LWTCRTKEAQRSRAGRRDRAGPERGNEHSGGWKSPYRRFEASNRRLEAWTRRFAISNRRFPASIRRIEIPNGRSRLGFGDPKPRNGGHRSCSCRVGMYSMPTLPGCNRAVSGVDCRLGCSVSGNPARGVSLKLNPVRYAGGLLGFRDAPTHPTVLAVTIGFAATMIILPP
jgi:hypothetical protein